MTKLGKDFGSVVNWLESGTEEPEKLYVGMPLTHLMWSDRHPYEIVEVIDQKHIKVRELGHRTPEGQNNTFTDCQHYEYYSDESNPIESLTKRGKYWYWGTKAYKGGATHIRFGKAEYYYDWSF